MRVRKAFPENPRSLEQGSVKTVCQPEQAANDKKQCQGCGICIGADSIERQSYQVGEYQICGHCLLDLKRWGKLQVEPYNKNQFLYPGGKVSKEKRR